MEGSRSGSVPLIIGSGSRTLIHKQDVFFYSLWNLSRLHCTVLFGGALPQLYSMLIASAQRRVPQRPRLKKKRSNLGEQAGALAT
jgi:hypothetical protein